MPHDPSSAQPLWVHPAAEQLDDSAPYHRLWAALWRQPNAQPIALAPRGRRTVVLTPPALTPLLAEQYHVDGILVRTEYVRALHGIVAHALGEERIECEASDPLDPDGGEELLREVPFSPFVDGEEQGRPVGVCVRGAPGSGLSLWLLYVLVLRLQAGLATVYQPDTEPHRVLVFTADGVFTVDITAAQRETESFTEYVPSAAWCLVDSGDAASEVPSFLYQRGYTIVHAARGPAKWLDRYYRARKTFVMKPWSLQETLVCLELQHELGRPTKEQVAMFFEAFACPPRTTFACAGDIQGFQDRLTITASGIPLSDLGRSASDPAFPYDSALVHLIPGTDRSESTAHACIPTSVIYTIIHSAIAHKTGLNATELERYLYGTFLASARLRPNACHALVRHMRFVLCCGGQWPLHPLRRGGRDYRARTMHWVSPPPDTPEPMTLAIRRADDPRAFARVRDESLLSLTLSGAHWNFALKGEPAHLSDGCYHPTGGALPACDMFVFEAEARRATVFVVAIGPRRGVDAAGLQWLAAHGAESVRFVAVTVPGAQLDFPFPDDVDLDEHGLEKIAKYQLVMHDVV
ncbi:hypothetical protein BC834DRAFT_49140 [Gloeopeniophorella convolvens]|nr:hypothetical protein BC834DRAFT_49140 [Gloeopeniophorella convolvens]